MRKGTVTIEGNTINFLGTEMRGGTITVYGNTNDFLGHNMSKGKITIHGNAGRCTGSEIRGGTLEIEGSLGSISPDIDYFPPFRCHGKIIHQGKNVFYKQSWYKKLFGWIK